MAIEWEFLVGVRGGHSSLPPPRPGFTAKLGFVAPSGWLVVGVPESCGLGCFRDGFRSRPGMKGRFLAFLCDCSLGGLLNTHLHVPYLKQRRVTMHRAKSRRERTTENPIMLATESDDPDPLLSPSFSSFSDDGLSS